MNHAFEDFSALIRDLAVPATLAQAGIVVACMVLAWLIAYTFFRRKPDAPRTIWNSQRPINSVAFPVLALLLVMAAGWALRSVMPMPLLRLAVPILASLVVVRIAARSLRAMFPNSAAVLAIERTFSWLVWGGMALWVTGLLPALLRDADDIKWTLGGSPVSLRSLLEGFVSAGVVLMLALWVSSFIESRLLANVSGGNLSLRKIAVNGVRALLLAVGLLLALSAAGIPIGALGVFGGAIGVGIGFGLQKLAANYVSGFVILAERSLRIGDMVKVDGFEGRITDIATRYTVVRALSGRESIVPNEMLITQRVENHSFADRKVLVTSQVQVAYGTHLDTLIPALQTAMAACERVVADPPPAVQLRDFAADGLTLDVLFWINDPENGQGNVRSEVNLAVLRTIESMGVEIPFPQRIVQVRAAGGQAPSSLTSNPA